MTDRKVRCEVVSVAGGGGAPCKGGAKMKTGEVFTFGARTPQPAGICSRSFMVIYPMAVAMRFSDETLWERGRGYIEVVCPEGHVVYRLERVRE